MTESLPSYRSIPTDICGGWIKIQGEISDVDLIEIDDSGDRICNDGFARAERVRHPSLTKFRPYRRESMT